MSNEENAKVLLDIIGKMMFVYGDEVEPLEKCKVFVATTVQQQLKDMLRKAKVTAGYRKCDKVEMVDFLFLFRRHHKQLIRMFQFLQSADLVRMFARDDALNAENALTTSTKLIVDDPEDDVVLSDYGKEAQKMYVAVSGWDSTGEIRRLLKQPPKDDVKTERMKHMSERADAMDGDAYKKFADARLCSMISNYGKRSERAVLRFLEWLGNPNVAPDTILLLSYVVSEMICVIVEGAFIARLDEDSSFFHNDPPKNCLQLRHYEQSLRKSRGYMEHRNVLIGYY